MAVWKAALLWQVSGHWHGGFGLMPGLHGLFENHVLFIMHCFHHVSCFGTMPIRNW